MATAGLRSRPSLPTVLLITTRLVGKSPPAGGHFIMATISHHSTFPSAATLTSSRGFLDWGTNRNERASCFTHSVRSSSVFPGRVQSVENPNGFGSKSNFHTGFRQEGRYISATSEDCRIRSFEEPEVEIESEIRVRRIAGGLSADVGKVEEELCSPEIWVVNFYHLVSVEDPHFEVARHTSFLEAKDVRGRIYISYQGINAQISGPKKDATEYAEWVKENSRFTHMLVQISPSPGGHAFPRLKIRYKLSLVQVEGGTLHLPITDPSARAVHLSPREWTERLQAATVLNTKNSVPTEDLGSLQDGQRMDSSGARKPVMLLDVRNGYEWDIGHFQGAQRPNVDNFKSTKFGLTEIEADPLAHVDKEAVDVMMYCTGGIRCDVYSTLLRQKGFKNLYTIKGGVSNYLKEEGAKQWSGNLFVFDARLSVPPRDYHRKESPQEETIFESGTAEAPDVSISSAIEAIARCHLCGDPLPEPRHRNCANLDCNLLYMPCRDCLTQHEGCCSIGCSVAQRRRPLITQHQYDRWHNYRPEEPKPPKPADYVSRRALKRRRRKENRKLSEAAALQQLNVQVLESC